LLFNKQGNVPMTLQNMVIGRSLDAMRGLKRYFERNGAVVDQELRNVFMHNISLAEPTETERDIVEEQMGKASIDFDKWTKLEKDSNVFVQLSKMYVGERAKRASCSNIRRE